MQCMQKTKIYFFNIDLVPDMSNDIWENVYVNIVIEKLARLKYFLYFCIRIMTSIQIII